MKIKYKSLALLIVLMFAGFTLTGCGDRDNGNSTRTTEPPAQSYGDTPITDFERQNFYTPDGGPPPGMTPPPSPQGNDYERPPTRR